MLKKYFIDFTNVNNYQDIHLIIAGSLGFSDYYGGNLDALHECLTEMLIEKSRIEIQGLSILGRYNGYDRKIYDAFLGAKHCLGKKFSSNLDVIIINEDGSNIVLPDELPCYSYTLDLSDAKTENDVIAAFTKEFEFAPEETKSFDDLWHQMLKVLFIKISTVDVHGLGTVKNDYRENILNILRGVKEAWNGKYADRFSVNIID